MSSLEATSSLTPAANDTSGRVKAREKRLINCHQVDVNQLMPLKYQWGTLSERVRQPLDAD